MRLSTAVNKWNGTDVPVTETKHTMAQTTASNRKKKAKKRNRIAAKSRKTNR